MTSNKPTTPQDVNGGAGIRDDPEALKSPIGAWLYSLRDTPFSQWTDFDVARAMRQDVFLEQVIPRALALLKSEPLAGAWDIGEVLKSFASVPAEYWKRHPDQQILATEAAKAAMKEPVFEYLLEDEDDAALIIAAIATGVMPKAKS